MVSLIAASESKQLNWAVPVGRIQKSPFEHLWMLLAEGLLTIAFFSNTPLSLFVTDGDTTAHGLDADFSVTGFTVDQPLEEAVTVKVTAKPTASDRAPVWV